MENRVNYDRKMLEEIERRRGGGELPRLLLHACCAPCSSASLERVVPYFRVTVFYYNPNIDDEPEYRKREAEEKRLIEEYNRRISKGLFPGVKADEASDHLIGIMEADYNAGDFYAAAAGLEAEPEGGERCTACFRLRLGETARAAARGGFELMTTTLTISPLKDAERLNRIGAEAAAEHGVVWLPSDFKKRDGYRRSIELSAEYGLYRQDYCGCSFSRRERAEKKISY